MKLLIYCRDSYGNDNWFECIGVIEHLGSLGSDGSSAGHYICDIKDRKTDLWFRTNDSNIPSQICVNEVSKIGYAKLFRRKDE